IGIEGQIQLLIASAEAGLSAQVQLRLPMKIGADIKGTFEGGKGVVLSIDPFVAAQLVLMASLHATLKASVLFFTILNKDYTLASMELGRIPLPTFKPFNPIRLQIGGPGGTQFLNGISLRPPGKMLD